MKNLKKRTMLLALLIIAILSISACDSEDDVTPVFALAFETTAVGLDESTSEKVIKVDFTTPASVASTVSIGVTEQNVAYGVDYSTSPAISNGVLTLDVPQGATEVTFTITKLADAIPKEATIDLKLNSISGVENAQISGNTDLKISFEAIDFPGTSVVAKIGGARQPNQVFIDLNLNKQYTAVRDSWDLGFYTGSDNRVIVNYSTYTMAKALDKTDLNSVSSTDTVGLSSIVRIGTAGTDAFIDHPDGDLTKTAIAEISSTDSENKVYIINRGSKPGTEDIALGSAGVGSVERGWKKVRILKTTDGYKIQYADIDATTFSETTISKDVNFNFSYFSFENGNVNVEPVKSDWDFVFTVSSNIISFGPGASGAYGFSDYVKTNGTNGVEVVEIVTEEDGEPIPNITSYDDFSLTDVASETFSNSHNIIGSSWRNVFNRSARSYKYYVVKDTDGSFYKIQFLNLLNSAGERGHSEFKYALLK
ncbi:MAG: hypothetical protein ACJAWV_001680 [Flammeovirgaceae bacterium]|jgi:hypothetical protein